MLCVTLLSCSTLQSALQIVNCKYDLAGVGQPSIAGVNLSNVTDLSQISAMDLIKLTTAFATKSLPLNATINVKATNPGSSAAAIQRLDWAIDLESKEILNGSVNQAINVPANGGTTVIPFNIGVDLLQLFSGESKDNLLNLALNLVNAGDSSSKVSIRVKPTVLVAGQPLSTGFITLSKSVSSK